MSLPPSDEPDAGRAAPALSPQYTVERELGRGGMATVYLARDTKHGRRVAVKVLEFVGLDDEGAGRFLVEIGLTARLSHPHIVPLLDSGNAGGRPFFVMPFVDGGTLRARTERGPLGTAETLKIAGEVADALAYAHAQGVLHRDVKPENIMMSGRNAVVADFGIARALQAADDQDASFTFTGLAVGTPTYMSPEQAAGDPGVDERSDVYSLGAVLYEMLTGDVPFAGESVQASIGRRFVEPPPSARAANHDVPEAVDAVVRQAMALDPAERFASAAEFGDALARAGRAVGTAGSVSPGAVESSVAILPFANAAGEADDEFLASGIADEVLATLSRGGSIRVAGRGSAAAVASHTSDPRELSARLGVRTLLSGSVRRAGRTLRVSAQLVNGADGFQLWGDKFDRSIDDLFAVQDEIAAQITKALRGALLPATGAAVTPPASPVAAAPEAYEAYLRGRHLLNRRTARDMTAAQEWFRRAVSLDDRFAAAHAGLADAWALLGVYGEVAPSVAFGEARRAADAALERNPSLAAAHAVVGLVQAAHDWDFATAARSFEAALARPAESSASQWLATVVLLPQARFDEALDATRLALRVDPLSLSARSTLTVSLLYARRLEEAVHAAHETLEIEPRFALAHFFLAQALAALGDTADAVASAERARELSGGSGETVAFAALAHGLHGDRARAAALAGELTRRAAERYVSESHLALATLGAGDVDGALAHLERAVASRATELIWLGVRPAWDGLRDAARFGRIMARVGVGGTTGPR